MLLLNRFDGAKEPYVSFTWLVSMTLADQILQMYLIANPPNMLPTQVLTGVNVSSKPGLLTPRLLSIGVWSNVVNPKAIRYELQPLEAVRSRTTDIPRTG